ncbi:acyltransferase family protein [Hyphomonas neptunium ATCC 15444]|uniref:Acyltransferase family protein n=2 Tax=Hyphomonas TaxID=85 RepID=Q0C4K9_HYPNA|nr:MULTISPECIES: acyltransferase [Hyphomonas]ABI76755.1 acyltransferase family protein [Hyphomonas neptunium ATCC 15444]KCZ96455.1 acyltransferase family protein [Hyphomonas hirschiana VP5]
MTRGFSLYLDALRFLAALVVLASHMGYERFTQGSLAWIRELNLGSDAVVVFFVLSGFVIAHTTFSRARGAAAYAQARMARLYSVILPALIVTFLLDQAGTAFLPHAYEGWWYNGAEMGEQYLRAVTFTTHVWNDYMRVGTNGPFWSVAYEAWYYAGFGVAVFCRGIVRWGLLGLMALVAGPAILLLAPCWGLGVLLQQAMARGLGDGISRLSAWVLALAPWGFYALALALQMPDRLLVQTWFLLGEQAPISVLGFSDEFLWNFVIANLMAAHFLGVHCLAKGAGWIGPRAESVIRWCAGATFSIYLFHYPILTFLHGLPGYDGTNAAHATLLAAVTLGACFALAEVSERRLDFWKQIVARVFDCIGARWLGTQAARA